MSGFVSSRGLLLKNHPTREPVDVLFALSEQLKKDGFCILSDALAAQHLSQMRKIVMNLSDRLPNTRSVEHSRHLAGFERFAEFSELFEMIDTNAKLTEFMDVHFGADSYDSFGLSDITVNRSQHWHTDLLRGRYDSYLEDVDPWSPAVGTCVKALVYLQSGKSLQVVPQSHLAKTPLNDALLEEMAERNQVCHIPVSPGDILMMDIRCLHRGSTESDMSDSALIDHPKILVSNVYAPKSSQLRDAMEAGNRARLEDWDERHLRGFGIKS